MTPTLFAAKLVELRDARANIAGEVETERLKAEEHHRRVEVLLAKIEGLNLAIEALEAEVSEEQPAPRRERMDIKAAVLDVLAGAAQTVAEIAAAIERKPHQISAALTRLSEAGKVELVPGTSDRYRIKIEQKEAAEAPPPKAAPPQKTIGIAAAERRGREDYRAGIPPTREPEDFDPAQRATWNHGYKSEAEKARAEQKGVAA